MLQAPRQIKRIAFQLYAPQWISQKPLHDRVDRQGTDSRIVAEMQEAVACMPSFVVEINSSLGMRLRIAERPAKPADRPGAVMGLQQDVRILKSVRNVEQFFGNLFRARKLTASDVKQPQPGGALDDILPDASGTSLLPSDAVDHSGNLALPKLVQGERSHVGPSDPGRFKFRPIGQD